MRVLLFCMSLAFCGFSMFPVVVCAHQVEVASKISSMSQEDKKWFFDWELKRGSIQDKFSYVLVVVKDDAWSGVSDEFLRQAKFLTSRACQSVSSIPDTCRIVDDR